MTHSVGAMLLCTLHIRKPDIPKLTELVNHKTSTSE